MWLLPGDTPEEAIDESIERVKSAIGSSGGETESAELWSRRTLSYPIKKQNEAVYCLAKFSIDSRRAPEFDHAMRQDQSLMRYLVTRRVPEKVTADDGKGKK
jgi:ribosomal protein S6